MSERENDGTTEANDKVKSKSNDDAVQNKIVVAVNRDENVLSDIFKLHAIACDDLFEYLSLKDLHSIGMTCRRMNRLAGMYFQENFRGEWFCLTKNGGIESRAFSRYDLSGFARFSENTLVHELTKEVFHYIQSNFPSIKNILFGEILHGPFPSFEEFKITLAKLEFVEIPLIGNGDIYEPFLKFCTNLKGIRIRTYAKNNNWLLQKYRKLEHVSLMIYDDIELYSNLESCAELKIFLEQNPTIQTIEILGNILLKIKEIFMTANATIDQLNIFCSKSMDCEGLRVLLNDLHGRCFYKRLHLLGSFHQTFVDLLRNLHPVEKLTILRIEADIACPAMKNVKELHGDNCEKFDVIFKCAVNVERVVWKQLGFDQILLLVSSLVCLREIELKQRLMLRGVFDILVLNKAREKLIGACKVIIYVPDPEYLPTKWAFGHLELNLIELRRTGSKPIEYHQYR